jgi:hypothetical protein
LRHIAGIIPVANIKTDHNLKTPEYLLPIGPDYTAIQKSVFECAIAGCNTIWIVANQDTAPIVKKIVGEWIYDPVYYNRSFDPGFISEQRIDVPIYYTGIRDKDRNRRDSYGWSAIHGIHSAWWVAYKMSRWVVPEKYFISFPMGVYDFNTLQQNRLTIAHRDKNYFSTYQGKTVKDNLPLSFTMRKEDFIQCRRHINKETTREYLPPEPGDIMPSKKRPLEDRWSARWFDFDTVFAKTKEKDSLKFELDWFYDISTWKGYRGYLGSDHEIEVPYKGLTKPRMGDRLVFEQ